MDREEARFFGSAAFWSIMALFVGGAVILAWLYIFGPAFKDQERRQFERSKFHRDAVVQDFTDRCAELATADSEEDKKAIAVVIAQRAAKENLDDLQMAASVRQCVENAINNYTTGQGIK